LQKKIVKTLTLKDEEGLNGLGDKEAMQEIRTRVWVM